MVPQHASQKLQRLAECCQEGILDHRALSEAWGEKPGLPGPRNLQRSCPRSSRSWGMCLEETLNRPVC